MPGRVTADYEAGRADERARLVWWLRAAAAGPALVSDPAGCRYAARLADVIEREPERFADAPVRRSS